MALNCVKWVWPLAFMVITMANAYHPNAVLCPLSEYIDDEDETVREYFECPGPEDPQDHTVCCEEKCCQLKHVDSVLGLDLKIAMTISLCVIGICLVTGIVLIVCCFAHPCPLYDTCSGSWDRDQTSIAPGMILALSPEDEEMEVQLLATKDQNGGVNHIVLKESSIKHEQQQQHPGAGEVKTEQPV
jgi:hypothetical protein